MALNRRQFHAPAESAWAVLADGDRYSDWVVGSRKVRDVDVGWPAPGTRIHHTVGIGPLSFDDDTEVVEVDPPHRILLEARLRPFATARVEIELEERDGVTHARIREELVAGPLHRLPTRLSDLLLRARNVVTLRRLGAIVESAAGRLRGSAAGSRSPA